jgi:hypothetical protein
VNGNPPAITRAVTGIITLAVVGKHALRLSCGHVLVCDDDRGPSVGARRAPCYECYRLNQINIIGRQDSE